MTHVLCFAIVLLNYPCSVTTIESWDHHSQTNPLDNDPAYCDAHWSKYVRLSFFPATTPDLSAHSDLVGHTCTLR
jgi:hypothetical protein